METTETQARFRTDDLALAATLHLEEFALVTVEARGRKAFFIFEYADGLDAVVDDYHDGVHEVEPRRFAQATKHCRNKMFDALDRARSNNNGR